MTSLNPVLTIGRQITEALEQHQGAGPRGGRAARARAAGDGRHRRSRPAPQAVSAPAFGRHAPAGDDRHRARLQSQADHRRRADDGARRHHPGADPRADEVADAPAQRRADHHHPQSRRGRPLRQPRERHVCRPDRRGRQRRGHLSQSPASLHDGAAALGAAARSAAARAPRSGRWPAARPDAARRRLRLPSALPVCRRQMRARLGPPLEPVGEAAILSRLLPQRRARRGAGRSPHERRATATPCSSRCAALPCTSRSPRASCCRARSAT